MPHATHDDTTQQLYKKRVEADCAKQNAEDTWFGFSLDDEQLTSLSNGLESELPVLQKLACCQELDGLPGLGP